MKTLLKKHTGIILFLVLISFSKTSAQTGIGTHTPDVSSALEVKSTNKGLLIPRLSTLQKNNITAPASGLILYDTDLNCLSVNNGTPAAPVWDCTTVSPNVRFFYMPSINIPTNESLIGVVQTKDLYGQYVTEFNTPVSRSAGAPASIPHYTNAADLNYYITYYDPALIEIQGVDANGKMTYKLLKTANFDSYINIVFMPK